MASTDRLESRHRLTSNGEAIVRRILVEYRFVISLALAGIVGATGLRVWPFPSGHPLLELVAAHRPMVYAGLLYAYVTVWFSTPFVLISIIASFTYIFVARADRSVRSLLLPPYPRPEQRSELLLILGEQHRRTSNLPAAEPGWLTIPERGLYTGMVIVGAIGTGKTSACMYP